MKNINITNWDWKLTNRDLVLFIPNFGRGKYIRQSIDILTKTSAPKDRWMILIGNDGVNEDFSDLEDKNVFFFNLERQPVWERGDGFIRNVAIKYCQSKLIAQKDPEIIYSGDFIQGCLDHPNELYRCGNLVYQLNENCTKDYFNDVIDLVDAFNLSHRIPILEDRFVFYHYGWCIERKTLCELHGYDEDYKYYAYADMDLHNRLIKCGTKQFFDKKCEPLHLFHNKPDTKNDIISKQREQKNKEIYEYKKRATGIIRNIGKDWGEGDLSYKPEIL